MIRKYIVNLPPLQVAAAQRDKGWDAGNVDACVWQFGDGGVSTDKNPSHTYAQAGTYVVTLGVTDNDGVGSDLVPMTVIVSEGSQSLK